MISSKLSSSEFLFVFHVNVTVENVSGCYFLLACDLNDIIF